MESSAALRPDSPVQVAEFQIGGMTCAACAARIERVLNKREGVNAAVNFASETARVRYLPGLATPEQLAEIIRKAGYEARERVETSSEDEKARRAGRAGHAADLELGHLYRRIRAKCSG